MQLVCNPGFKGADMAPSKDGSHIGMKLEAACELRAGGFWEGSFILAAFLLANINIVHGHIQIDGNKKQPLLTKKLCSVGQP